MANSKSDAVPRKATYVKVKDLAPGSHGHNVVVKVISIEPVQEKPRYDGTSSRIAEAMVGDETGVVILTARNEQIDKLKTGGVLVIRNCSADVFNGFVRLNVTMWGKISAHPDGIASTPAAPPSVNRDNNISAIEYELVTVAATEE